MNKSKYFFNMKIPMRDNTELSADIYMPDTSEYEVLLIRTPYNNMSEDLLSYANYFVEKGFCLVLQDVRGRGDSDGVFTPFKEKDDGYDTIKWIVSQSWCINKRVGMVGGSYQGLVQFEAAKNDLPELKVIAPAVIGNCRFEEGVKVQGILITQVFDWAASVSGRTMQNIPSNTLDVQSVLPVRDFDKTLGMNIPFLQEWLNHPTYDDYWKEFSIDKYYEKYNIPILIIGGWYDKFILGTLKNYIGIKKGGGIIAKKNLKLMIGPWAHHTHSAMSVKLGPKFGDLDFGEGRSLNSLEVVTKWINRYLKEEKNNIENELPVSIFIMGENVWRHENSWPLQNTKYIDFFLGSNGQANSMFGNGTLNKKIQNHKKSDSYTYDPNSPVPGLGSTSGLSAEPLDQRPIERRDDVLVYTSDELTTPLEVTGFIQLEIFVSSSAIDTDFYVKFCDVHPDGKSINLSEGIIRTRFREGFEKEVMMIPREIYKLKISIGATANLFLVGHKIRLEITSSCFPGYIRNLNTGESMYDSKNIFVAEQTIHHSTDYPSKLILPVIPRNF